MSVARTTRAKVWPAEWWRIRPGPEERARQAASADHEPRETSIVLAESRDDRDDSVVSDGGHADVPIHEIVARLDRLESRLNAADSLRLWNRAMTIALVVFSLIFAFFSFLMATWIPVTDSQFDARVKALMQQEDRSNAQPD